MSNVAGMRDVTIFRFRPVANGHQSCRLVTAGHGKGWGWWCECGFHGQALRRSWAELAWRAHREGKPEPFGVRG